MSKTELRIATTDISAGFDPEAVQGLKGLCLALDELIDEGHLSENISPSELRTEYEAIGNQFVRWWMEVRVRAKKLN